METVNPILWRFLESPRRGLIVIILTVVVGLLTLWPAVDNYLHLQQRAADTVADIEQAEIQKKKLPQFQARLEENNKRLAALELKTINDNQARELRNDVVEWTRQAGCKVRRIDLEAPQRRPWLENDHPFQPPVFTKKSKKTPYTLRTQKMIVSIRGEFSQVRALLAQIQETPYLMHTQGLNVRPLGEESTEVMLELEVILVGLEDKAGKQNG